MTRRPAVATAALLAASAVALSLGGCAPKSSSTNASANTSATSPAGSTPTGSAASPSDTAAACSKDSMQTLTPGTLTIATDKPVYEPWFVNDTPDNGKGFEGAVAAAVEAKLGYGSSDVKWVRVPFDNVIKPGKLSFDFDINEFSITAERRQAVDFSSPYYDVTQAVIVLKKSPFAAVTTVAGLKSARIGAQIGTTSYKAARDVIKPSKQVAVYNTNDDAKKALQNRQIDALVTDLPTALYITAAELTDAKIAGQLANQGGTPEQFGLVLAKNSPITSCVSQAVDALKADGTLAKLQSQWLAASAGAPVLQ